MPAFRHILLLFLPILCLLPGCGSPGSEIERVLSRCAEVSAEVNRSSMDSAQAANYIATEFQKIDTRDCPEDFRRAFQAHINAWKAGSHTLQVNVPLASFLEGFVGGYTGDYSQVGATAYDQQQAIQYINITYFKLTEIAAAHGARIPKSETNR